MLPVLFSLGPIPISSFGFFLSIGFIFATFLIWRLARAWDLNEEKVLDLILLTFFGGLLGARIYFVALNFDFFSQDLFKALLLTKYPGFSFWGGFLGGWLTLFVFAQRLKVDFWQAADLGSIGFLGGLIFGGIGCFLGGCSVGIPSSFLATPVVGVLDKRFPTPLVEAIIFGLILIRLWPQAKKFHFRGKIISLSLILVGVTKFFMEFLRDAHQGGFFFSAILAVLGVFIFYHGSRRDFKEDIKSALRFLVSMVTETSARRAIIVSVNKQWYNYQTAWGWKMRELRKTIKKYVKPTPKNI